MASHPEIANPRSQEAPKRLDDALDRAATGASILCLAHCLLLPLLFAALPAIAGIVDVPEEVHLFVVLFALPTSLWALLSGRSSHHRTGPLVAGVAGLALLLAGLAIPSLETAATVAGSLLLSLAHGANWRLRHGRTKVVAPARLPG